MGKRLVLDQDEMIDNIIGYWNRATTVDRQAGTGWYPVAYEIAEEVGALCGGDVTDGAGIIAALSPRQQWTRNIAVAREVAARPYLRPSGVFTHNWAKANRIAHGERPSQVLGGRKVTAFYRNILGDETCVCVDGHAFHLASGGLPTKQLERRGVYDQVQAAYITASEMVGVRPTVIQAITWLVRQREQRRETAAFRVRARKGK